MITHPNQRVVQICTKKVTKDFIQVAKEDIKAACLDLTPAQTLVWLIFAGNAEGYNFVFSPTAIEKEYGISKQTAQNAFKVLIEKGYLEPTKASTHFRFHLKPIGAADLEMSTCEVVNNEPINSSSSAEKKSLMDRVM